MAFEKVATVAEVPPGKCKAFTIQGKAAALFNIDGTFYAIGDTCPHRGAPLHQGQCQGTVVICPWHGAQFDLTSGAHLSPPARSGVPAFKVQVVGDEIHVEA